MDVICCKLRRLGILVGFLVFFSIELGMAQDRPSILVKVEDKAAILEKIKTERWAGDIYSELWNKITPLADRHRTDPEWILSRYQMNRVKGKRYTDFLTDPKGTKLIAQSGDAPFSTVRPTTHKRPPLDPEGYRFRTLKLEEFPVYDSLPNMYLQSSGPSGKWYWTDPQSHIGYINGLINGLCLESAILYWLTKEEKYAKFAMDILVQWVQGAYYQKPLEGACRDGFFSVQSLGDRSYATLPLAYDFIYDYLKSNYDEIGRFDSVFDRLAQTQLDRGFWSNNWYAAQSITFVYSTLALSDRAKRDKYMNYFMKEDHVNKGCGRLSLTSTAEKHLTYDGHWKEPGGYHNYPVGAILQAGVAAENNEYLAFKDNPPLYTSSYVLLKYLFPNGKTMGYGDTGRGTASPEHLEIAIKMAGKYDDPVQKQLYGVMNMMLDEGYNRNTSGWFGLLNNVSNIPEEADEVLALPRSGKLEFSQCYYQRNGTDSYTGLMCYLQGASYNHNHANGVAMELYGQGMVLGLDPGIGGHYDTDIHKNYYALYAAHNTVIADGKSGPLRSFNGGGGEKPMGALTLQAMEPMAEFKALSPFCSYTSVDYLEPSTETQQKRTMALIRTSDKTGYYVDIFHSDNANKNEYVYHNLGHTLTYLDTTGKTIELSPTKKLSEHKKGFGPGYVYFSDKMATGILGKSVKAQFQLNTVQGEKIFMDMHIPGAENREYFSVMTPKAYTAPQEYKELPVPAAIIRQNGSAWEKPFMVLYESFTGKGSSSLNSVIGTSESGISVMNASSNIAGGITSQQTIVQNIDSTSIFRNGNEFFKGHFGVIGYENDTLAYLYLGHGSEISANGFSLRTTVENKYGAANLMLKNEELFFASYEAMQVFIPKEYVKRKRGFEVTVTIDKTPMKLKTEKVKGGWNIQLPATEGVQVGLEIN